MVFSWVGFLKRPPPPSPQIDFLVGVARADVERRASVELRAVRDLSAICSGAKKAAL